MFRTCRTLLVARYSPIPWIPQTLQHCAHYSAGEKLRRQGYRSWLPLLSGRGGEGKFTLKNGPCVGWARLFEGEFRSFWGLFFTSPTKNWFSRERIKIFQFCKSQMIKEECMYTSHQKNPQLLAVYRSQISFSVEKCMLFFRKNSFSTESFHD